MNGEVDMHFGINLRKAREERGWTQEELAEKAGLQPSWISHFESARRHPSLMNFQALCCALRVPADTLLFGPSVLPCPFCNRPLESRGGYYACPNRACSFPLGYAAAAAQGKGGAA